MSWVLADGFRVVVIAALVSAMTSLVWTKVQHAEAAGAMAVARTRTEDLREERSKLSATVELARRPVVVARRAQGELQMERPDPQSTRALFVSRGMTDE